MYGEGFIGFKAKDRESKYFGSWFLLFYHANFKYTSQYVAKKKLSRYNIIIGTFKILPFSGIIGVPIKYAKK